MRNLTRRTNAALWTIQGVLALVFLFAGGMKLVMPADALAAQSPLPVGLLRFIGTAEVLGAIGLILPGLFSIVPVLTSFAAAGLVIIMIGATVITAATQSVALAVVPFIVGVLAAVVAFGRRSAAASRFGRATKVAARSY